ncbi:MAG: ABC-F family ATP-binding cassette domain-containing protein [Clostridia bacterium]|nr:ABC-F family ATP-binding cassette domain-containing protein [Clostridia bacterium]
MNILSAEKIVKAYSEKQLLNEVSVGIDDAEKTGVIGINGTGKSTFLKILAGIETADSGNIIMKKGLTIEYLSQNPVFDEENTVLQQVFKGNSPVMKLLREYESCMHELSLHSEDGKLQKKMGSLTQQIDNMKAWSIEGESKAVLTKLGITEFSAKVGKLSGGQKKRIALASALITPSELLILDEPTNQLDNDTIDWLEKYLNTRKGALLLVTHDRYFLQRVCQKIIEIENGNLYQYQANYETYLELKEQKEDSDVATERKRQSLYKKELEWIKRGARARSTKQKARIERFEELENSKLIENNEDIEINVGTTRLGKKIIELENTGKDYHGKKVINDFSYVVKRDDRIGIIGPNGSGKSTLLKMIAGNLLPDRGQVIVGETVKTGFFTQENEVIDDSIKVIDYIREQAEFLTTDEGVMSAGKMLEMFLFPADVHWKSVSNLSGGERRRLYLLKILMGAPNVLLLDEPTNDLDIKILTILENYLNDFKGAVIAVSHDRYFLDRVANRIFIFNNQATIKQVQGNYTDYYQEKQLEDEKNKPNKEKTASSVEYKKNRTIKFTFNEQREFEKIDTDIEALEKAINDIGIKIRKDASDFVLLQKHMKEQEELERQLETKMERWVYLNELNDLITKNKNEKKGENNE